jgi:hypothetical protein
MTEEYNQYLWNKSGMTDPEIEQLEAMLSELRYTETEPAFLPVAPRPASPRQRWAFHFFPRVRVLQIASVAAVLFIGLGALIVRHRLVWQNNRPWTIAAVSGSPRIENRVGSSNALAVGESLITDASSSAEVRIGHIGTMTVEPNSRVRLLETGTDRQRVALEYGTIRARTWAPPFSFAIETSSSTVFDLGCAFRLHVEKSGLGLVHVDSGWVQFEYGDEQTIVPAGAEAITRPHVGPGSVHFPDATLAFRTALNTFDISAAGSDERSAAIAIITREARARDAVTLLSLLHKVGRPEREALLNALERFVPIPSGTLREQVLNLDPPVMDQYWHALGFGNPKSWIMHWRDVFGN